MIKVRYKNLFVIITFIIFITQCSCNDKNTVLDEYIQIDKYLYYKNDIQVLEDIISNSCIDLNTNNKYEYSECSIDPLYDENNDGIVDPLEVGVTEWGKNRRLIVLFASYRGISGNLSEKIWDLTKLEKLDLRNNQIVGDFPEGIENLQELKEIWIDNNSISGEIYEEFNLLESLEIMSLSNNLFSSISNNLCEKINSLDYYSIVGNIICNTIDLTECTLDLIGKNQNCP